MPVGLKNDYTGVDGWPCQRVSLYKDSKMGSESVEVLLWVIIPRGWRKPEFGHFWGFCGFGCLNDKTSHRLQSENIAAPLQSQIFDRRERKMSNLHGCASGNLQCIASPMPLQDLLRIYHIRKIPNIATLAFDLNITYRAILNIELYNWQLQKGLQKLR